MPSHPFLGLALVPPPGSLGPLKAIPEVSDGHQLLLDSTIFDTNDSLPYCIEGGLTETHSLAPRSLTAYVKLNEEEKTLLRTARDWTSGVLDSQPHPDSVVSLFVYSDLHRLLISTLIDTTGKQQNLRLAFCEKLDSYLKVHQALSKHWEDTDAFSSCFATVEPLLAGGCAFWSHKSRESNLPVLICQMGKLTRSKTDMYLVLEFCLYYAIYNLCVPGESEQVEIVLDMHGVDVSTLSLTELIDLNNFIESLLPARVRRVIVLLEDIFQRVIAPLFQQFLSPKRLKQFSFTNLQACVDLKRYVAMARSATSTQQTLWPFPIASEYRAQVPKKSFYECLGLSWWRDDLEGLKLEFANDHWKVGPHRLQYASQVEALIVEGVLKSAALEESTVKLTQLPSDAEKSDVAERLNTSSIIRESRSPSGAIIETPKSSSDLHKALSRSDECLTSRSINSGRSLDARSPQARAREAVEVLLGPVESGLPTLASVSHDDTTSSQSYPSSDRSSSHDEQQASQSGTSTKSTPASVASTSASPQGRDPSSTTPPLIPQLSTYNTVSQSSEGMSVDEVVSDAMLDSGDGTITKTRSAIWASNDAQHNTPYSDSRIQKGRVPIVTRFSCARSPRARLSNLEEKRAKRATSTIMSPQWRTLQRYKLSGDDSDTVQAASATRCILFPFCWSP